MVREAIEHYLAAREPGGGLPSFAAVGDSGRTDVSAKHEELLFADLDPHHGAPAARSVRYRAPIVQGRRRPARGKR